MLHRFLQLWAQTGHIIEPYLKPVDVDSNASNINLERIEALDKKARKALGRSIFIRHLDTGSCNAEEAELVALGNPYYDLVRYGIDFTATPRHADVLAVTGPVTRHLKVAMERTYEATPNPKIVVAIGDGACYGTPYVGTYACLGRVDQFLPVDIYIPGDPPSPHQIIEGLVMCKYLLAEKISAPVPKRREEPVVIS